ncbi:radical SAM domain-containing protein [Clostridium baratii]|uniref:radical SAM protein n=1 Tax=Clostridium baratii TaxID=1561 RepID=UPI0006C5E65A|nr:radical SAM domain-containing protein [Clostridium baratii]
MNYMNMLNNCNLCIRNCGVNRLKGETGACNSTDKVKASKAYLHMWEEPPISLDTGSGTVFFSNCNFRCVFCQNHEISQENKGVFISNLELSNIFLNLQAKGANNINLVTPTHYVPQIIEALKIAKSNGLTIPILYNTNGYDSLDTIKALDGYIDVYLPDFKYYDDKYAIKYSKAPEYRENVINILKEMYKQVGKNKFDEKGRMTKGLIIRHLMLPGLLFDSKKVIDTIYSLFGDNVYISIMNQYTPMFNAFKYKELSKPLNPKLYDSLIDYAASIGVKNAFIQESGSNTDEFVPSFDLEGIL